MRKNGEMGGEGGRCVPSRPEGTRAIPGLFSRPQSSFVANRRDQIKPNTQRPANDVVSCNKVY